MYKISDIARLFGVSEKTLRLYEEYGLLSPSRRGESNNYRYYDHRAILRLNVIRNLKHLGLTLEDIKLHFSGEPVLYTKLAELKEKRARLDTYISRIESLSAEGFARCRISERPIEYCLRRDITAHDVNDLTQPMWELFDYAVKNRLTVVSDHKISNEFTEPPFYDDGRAIEATICLSLIEPYEETVTVPRHLEANTLFYAHDAQTSIEMYALLDDFVKERGLEKVGKYREYYLSYIDTLDRVDYTPLVHLAVPVKPKYN